MTSHDDHEEMMMELVEQFAPVMDNSTDGVYIWLDETAKVCSEKLARMFGYTIAEWRAKEPFLDSFIAPEDRAVYSWNYHNCVANLAHPATFRFRGIRKDGSTFAAETDMIPISWRGHAIAYHFVRQIAE
jgi:PAS domain S-box-containing protein